MGRRDSIIEQKAGRGLYCVLCESAGNTNVPARVTYGDVSVCWAHFDQIRKQVHMPVKTSILATHDWIDVDIREASISFRRLVKFAAKEK